MIRALQRHRKRIYIFLISNVMQLAILSDDISLVWSEPDHWPDAHRSRVERLIAGYMTARGLLNTGVVTLVSPDEISTDQDWWNADSARVDAESSAFSCNLSSFRSIPVLG
jgi:hypothetical protein